MTRLRFSAPSGLSSRVATGAASGFSSSSACRFLLARRCGGRSGPMDDMLVVLLWIYSQLLDHRKWSGRRSDSACFIGYISGICRPSFMNAAIVWSYTRLRPHNFAILVYLTLNPGLHSSVTLNKSTSSKRDNLVSDKSTRRILDTSACSPQRCCASSGYSEHMNNSIGTTDLRASGAMRMIQRAR
jgi:hypothetical protein